MKRTCVQCGKEFELTNSEIGFYKKRKLALPKRCRECREQNRQSRPGNAGRRAEQMESSKAEFRQSKAAPVDGTVKNRGNLPGRTENQVKNRGNLPGRNENQVQNTRIADQKNSAKEKQGFFLSPRLAAILFCALAIIYFAVTGQFDQAEPSVDTGNEAVTQENNASSGGNTGNGQSAGEAQDVDEAQAADEIQNADGQDEIVYTFRSEELFETHYEKHGIEMGFATPEDYLEGANLVIADPNTLHKTEGEDGDDVYFLEETNEFVVVSTDGYIRTYFEPEDGMEYYERQ